MGHVTGIRDYMFLFHELNARQNLCYWQFLTSLRPIEPMENGFWWTVWSEFSLKLNMQNYILDHIQTTNTKALLEDMSKPFQIYFLISTDLKMKNMWYKYRNLYLLPVVSIIIHKNMAWY